MADQEAFQAAADWLSTSPAAAQLTNEAKLELYGLYKIVNAGAPDGARPSFFNPTARAKYDAWVEQHSEHPEAGDARERYMEIAEELGWKRDSKAPKGMGVSVSMMSGEQAALGTSEIHNAVIANDLARVEAALSRMEVVNERDEYGNTPLHIAADRGLTAMARILIQRGADVNAKDEEGETPLDLATTTDREEIISLLQNAAGG